MMFFSGYEVEEFLRSYRRFCGKQVTSPATESLKISQEAQHHSYQTHSPKNPRPWVWVSPQEILSTIANTSEVDPIINYEQQRRAGLLLSPPYIPPNPPPPIPKVATNEESELKTLSEEEQAVARSNMQTLLFKPQPESSPEDQPENTPAKRIEDSKVESPEPSKQEEPAPPLDLSEIEESSQEAEDDLDAMEQGSWGDDDASVVYGNGAITQKALIEFVHENPDSVLKFITRRELDGKPISAKYHQLYEVWEKRGLSRKSILKYVCYLMEWDSFPAKQDLHDTYNQLRDRLYDIAHSSNDD